jgi:hypothetical protein
MSVKIHGLWAAGLNVALVASLSAQAPQTPAPSTSPAQNPAQRGPDFRARVDLVTNDIVVRDSKGNFVPDLKPEDIQVYEDGVLQELVSMTVVTGGRVYNPMAPPTAAAPEGIILPKRRTVSDVSGRIFLFFVDDQHLQFGNTSREQLFQKISKEWSTTAFVRHRLERAVIDSGRHDATKGSSIRRTAETSNELKPTEIINGSTAGGPSEIRYRAHVAFDTMLDGLKNSRGAQPPQGLVGERRLANISKRATGRWTRTHRSSRTRSPGPNRAANSQGNGQGLIPTRTPKSSSSGSRAVR